MREEIFAAPLAQQIYKFLRDESWLQRKAKAKGRFSAKLHLEALEDRFLPATSVNQVVPAALTGTAFIDHNQNNVLDANEIVLPGATVTLTGTDYQNKAVKATAVTDANGVYQFLQVNPGTYQVSLSTNGSFLVGGASAGSNGGIVSGSVISSISITQGETLVGYNLAVQGLANQGISLRQFLSTTLLIHGIPTFALNTPVVTAGSGLAYADGAPPPAILTSVGTGSLAGFVKDTLGNPMANVTASGLTGVTSERQQCRAAHFHNHHHRLHRSLPFQPPGRGELLDQRGEPARGVPRGRSRARQPRWLHSPKRYFLRH